MTEVQKLRELFANNSVALFLASEVFIADGEEAIKTFDEKTSHALWVYHPFTRTFYSARVRKDKSGWIRQLESGRFKEAPAIVKHMLAHHKQFVYISAPAHALLHVEHTLARFSRRAATPRRTAGRYTSTALWALYQVGRPDTNMYWRVTAPANSTSVEVLETAIRSMKNTLARSSDTYRRLHMQALRLWLTDPRLMMAENNVSIMKLKEFPRMDTDGVIRGEQVNQNILMLEAIAGMQTNMLTLPGTKNLPSTVGEIRSVPMGKPAFKLN